MAGRIIFILLLTCSSGEFAQAQRNPVTVTNPASASSVFDVLSNTLNLFTNVPISIARSLRGGSGVNGLPVLPVIDNNLASLSDNFIAEFNFGLRNEDCKLNCTQLLSKYGHPVEIHETVTEDGYVLKLFRIPSDGPVVLLQHGMIGSADEFVVAGSESGLAYVLAKHGYDVWLGNTRGNKHSRRHVELKPSQAAFWDFSWHENGYYDIPAEIDYILNVTNREKLKFIGFSQGTTAFFVTGAERPEYMDKIELMVAMAPAAFNSNMKSPFMRLLAPSSGLLFALSKSFGIHEFAPDNNFMRLARWVSCGTGPLAELFCSNMMFVVAGFNAQQVNASNLPIFFSHVPSGASAKQLVHYAQGIISQKFRQFDYGPEGNRELYGSVEPPDYDLRKLNAPVALIYSDADWLVDPRDVAKLEKLLPNVVESYKVPDRNFNHMDYILAKDVKRLVYKRVLKLLSGF